MTMKSNEPSRSVMSGETASTARGHGRTAALTLGAVGVVYGDIGTSPLYAFREALRPAAADGLTQAEVLGVVSLLLWALVLIVTLKYVLFLLRADNRGEGGILALYALVQGHPRKSATVFFLGVIGAALFLATPSLRRRFQFCPPSRA